MTCWTAWTSSSTPATSVGLRGSAGLETRVFVPEFADREINSPGEPGVCYQMGIGFTGSQATGRAAEILADLRQRAENRNRALLARVNAHLRSGGDRL